VTIVRHILSSSRNLTKIKISAPTFLNATRSLTKESYATLKDIQISYENYLRIFSSLDPYDDVPAPSDPRFDILLEISDKGLRLETFSILLNIEIKTKDFIFPRFIEFMQAQSKYLKSLEIQITCLSSFDFLNPFIPKFPVMEKLRTLKIKDNKYTLLLPFEDRNLARQFPALNRIEISVAAKESILQLVTIFLGGFDIAGENLKFIHICIFGRERHAYPDTEITVAQCMYCFHNAVLKIPKLKEFKISLSGLPNMICYSREYIIVEPSPAK